MTKGAVVEQVLSRFGNAFQKAFTCNELLDEADKRCKVEAKKALDSFHEELPKLLYQNLKKSSLKKSSANLAVREAGNELLDIAQKLMEIEYYLYPDLHGLTGEIPTSEELENFFKSTPTGDDNPPNKSFVDWVNKVVPNGRDYDTLMEKTIKRSLEQSYANDPEKAMTDFLNDITAELSNISDCSGEQPGPDGACPKLCAGLKDCLTKLYNNQQQFPNLVTQEKRKIDEGLQAIERDLAKFQANPEFNSKNPLAQN